MMLDRTIVPIDDRQVDCVCGPATDLAQLASLLHGWPLVFTAVAVAALVVLSALLLAPARHHRGRRPERERGGNEATTYEGTTR